MWNSPTAADAKRMAAAGGCFAVAAGRKAASSGRCGGVPSAPNPGTPISSRRLTAATCCVLGNAAAAAAAAGAHRGIAARPPAHQARGRGRSGLSNQWSSGRSHRSRLRSSSPAIRRVGSRQIGRRRRRSSRFFAHPKRRHVGGLDGFDHLFGAAVRVHRHSPRRSSRFLRGRLQPRSPSTRRPPRRQPVRRTLPRPSQPSRSPPRPPRSVYPSADPPPWLRASLHLGQALICAVLRCSRPPRPPSGRLPATAVLT